MDSESTIRIVTHNGSFHADDLFACAVLKILYPKAEIIRTRDEAVISSGDIVLDVGGEYDPERRLFDHHQKGGAGVRENGIPYASLGLIWKHFGLSLCDENREVWEKIEYKIVMPLDAIDNGVDTIKPIFENVFPYTADQSFLSFSPTWKEGEGRTDEIFLEQVDKIKPILVREITVAFADAEAKKIILEAAVNALQKELVMLDNPFPRYLYQKVLGELPDALFVILPRERNEGWKKDEGWKVEAIRKNSTTMESRKYLPEAWAGLRDGALQKVTGVGSAIFCHNGRFMIATKTKDDAFTLAKLALQA